MPYRDPMDYLGYYFQPRMRTAVQALPGILQLEQRKKEFAAGQPYLQAQTDIAKERATGLRQTREDYRSLIEGGIPGFGELLPEGMTPETYFRGKKHGLFGPISMARPKPGETLEDIEEKAAARARGTAAGKPPTVPKALERIEAEAGARAKGALPFKTPPKPPKAREILYTHIPSGQKVKVAEGSPQDLDYREDLNYQRGVPTKLTPTPPAPPRPPTEMQTMGAQRQIQNRLSALAQAKLTLEQTGIADQYIAVLALASGMQLTPGQPVDQPTMQVLIAQWDREIVMLDDQLKQLGYVAPPTALSPTSEAGSFIQRFKGK